MVGYPPMHLHGRMDSGSSKNIGRETDELKDEDNDRRTFIHANKLTDRQTDIEIQHKR